MVDEETRPRRAVGRGRPSHADRRAREVHVNRPGEDSGTGSIDPVLIGRLGFVAVAAFSFTTGLKLYSAAGIWAPSVPLGLALYSIAIVSLGAAAWHARPLERRAQAAIGAALLFILGSSIAYEISHSNPGYGTDAIAFAHAGSEILLRGENPYAVAGSPLEPVLERFGVPTTFVTRSLSGEPIDRLISYPGGHVLAYSTGAALGIEDMRWVTLAFELAAFALMWWTLMPQLRSILVLVLLIEPNLTVLFTSGGVTDWLWVLPLLGATVGLVRHRFGWAGIAFGVACAMKQQPWFAVPFALIWVYQTTRRSDSEGARGTVGSFTAGLAVGFLSLNLPFILWDPASWTRGVLAPAISDLVPDGQGLSILASRGLLPLPQEAFALATLLVGALCIVLYYRFFDRVSELLWVLPPVVLFFSYRSFHNYFVYWLPIVLFWFCLRSPRTTTHSARHREARTKRWGLGQVGALLIGLVVTIPMVAVATTSAPLRIESVEPSLQDGVVTSLNLELTNRSDEAIAPSVDVYWSGWPVPWRVDETVRIQAGETSFITVVPPGPEAMPGIRRLSNGEMRYEPFRVRVHARGQSQFDASQLVEVPKLQVDVVNPDFSLWGKISHSAPAAPYAWRTVTREGAGASLQTGPIGGDRGVAIRLSSAGLGDQGWAESALVQDVPALSACYQVRLNYSPNDHDRSSRPTGDVGIQLIQGGSSLWFVASPISVPRVTDLPGNVRIVELPALQSEWVELTMDVEGYRGGSGLQVGKPASIKLFNTLLVSEPGNQELLVSRIAGCSSD